MRLPNSFRAAAASVLLAGCAPKHLPEGYQPLPMDPAVFDCVNATGGRIKDLPALRECLDRVEATARVEKGPFAEVPTQSVGVREMLVASTREVLPGRPEDFSATVTPSVNAYPEVNLTPDVPVLQVSPTGNRPLAREDWAAIGSYEVERGMDSTGRVVQGSMRRNYDARGADQLQINQWSPDGEWGQIELPCPGGSMENILSIQALSSGGIAFVAGDLMGKFPESIGYGGGSLWMGEWNADHFRKVDLLKEGESPYRLNGGFVEVDERTWLVSAKEGILITRDAGQHWAKMDLDAQGVVGSYGAEGVQSYGIFERGGAIHLVLQYDDKLFSNYVWEVSKGQWVYDGASMPNFYGEAESETGSLRWQTADREGAPVHYRYEELGFGHRPTQIREIDDHGKDYGVQVSVQPMGEAVSRGESVNLATARIEDRRYPRTDFETDPTGRYNLRLINDRDPSYKGKGTNGARLFVSEFVNGRVVSRELQLEGGPRSLHDAWLLNGYVMIAYQANPQEKDSRLFDIRVTAVPFNAIFPPEQTGSTQPEGTREYVPMTGYL